MATPAEALVFSHEQRAQLERHLPRAESSDLTLPFVTLTWAASLDAQIAAAPGARTVLSGRESKAMTHYLRTRHDAIMIGVTTLLVDNPSLNCRLAADDGSVVGLDHQPIPVILDPSARWAQSMTRQEKLWQNVDAGRGKPPIWVVSDDAMAAMEADLRHRLVADGVLVAGGPYHGAESGVAWDVVLAALQQKGIRSVMIEGGARVISDLLRRRNHRYVHSVIVTVAPTFLGAGGVAVLPDRSDDGEPAARLQDVGLLPLGEDIVISGHL